MLGTNGGGFYNSNSAVPFENPNGLTNFFEMIGILLIPMAEVFMFGRMVLARRHAWAVFAAMFAMLAIGVGVLQGAEHHGSAVLRASGVNLASSAELERRQHDRQGDPLRGHERRPVVRHRDRDRERRRRLRRRGAALRPEAAPRS